MYPEAISLVAQSRELNININTCLDGMTTSRSNKRGRSEESSPLTALGGSPGPRIGSPALRLSASHASSWKREQIGGVACFVGLENQYLQPRQQRQRRSQRIERRLAALRVTASTSRTVGEERTWVRRAATSAPIESSLCSRV